MNLINMLIDEEGLELKPYRDHLGNTTIGVGRNLDDVGISYNEAMLLLQNDIERARQEADKFWWAANLDPVRLDVVVMMLFQLGLPRFRGFVNMIAAIEKANYGVAKTEMLNSLWANQTPARAKRLAWMMEHGRYPEEDDVVL
jgi:lysozyme